MDERAGDSVLSYATSTEAPTFVRTPWWLKAFVATASLLILFGLVLGMPPLAGALDYTRDIPLSEAIAYAAQADWRGVLAHQWVVPLVLFVPAMIIVLFAFLTARQLMTRRIVVTVGFVMPALWLWHWWPVSIMIMPELPLAFLGGCDGETWSEGFVCYSALANWSALWAAVAVTLYARSRLRG